MQPEILISTYSLNKASAISLLWNFAEYAANFILLNGTGICGRCKRLTPLLVYGCLQECSLGYGSYSCISAHIHVFEFQTKTMSILLS